MLYWQHTVCVCNHYQNYHTQSRQQHMDPTATNPIRVNNLHNHYYMSLPWQNIGCSRNRPHFSGTYISHVTDGPGGQIKATHITCSGSLEWARMCFFGLWWIASIQGNETQDRDNFRLGHRRDTHIPDCYPTANYVVFPHKQGQDHTNILTSVG